jgi:hypothetical protein
MKIFDYFPPAKYDFLLDFGFSLIYIRKEIRPGIGEEIKNG